LTGGQVNLGIFAITTEDASASLIPEEQKMIGRMLAKAESQIESDSMSA
jgi:hypothetical protein